MLKSLVIGLVLFSAVAQAREDRFFIKMPTGTKLSGVEFKKSKKSAWQCAAVKVGDKGNWNAVSGAKTVILASVPESDKGADEATRAVRCTLKIFDTDKHRIANAELGE